jgi:O-methyltransferase involved in polyketide biosynthesis
MEMRGHISESAFLVNESRARRVELSGDLYAHLWVTDRTRDLWNAFCEEVYPHDEIELGLRNRFFLDRLDSFVAVNSGAVFVNIGAGFTSYPFLTRAVCRCFEVDYPRVVDYKRRNVHEWRASGALPSRDVEFVGVDLAGAPDRARLREALLPATSDAPSFILMEGITYYLERPVLDAVFEMCSELQRTGSVLAFDFWTPGSAFHPVHLRFAKFCAERFGRRASRYSFLEEAEVGAIAGYAVEETAEVQGLELIYSATRVLQDPSAILPESYAVLRRAR